MSPAKKQKPFTEKQKPFTAKFNPARCTMVLWLENLGDDGKKISNNKILVMECKRKEIEAKVVLQHLRKMFKIAADSSQGEETPGKNRLRAQMKDKAMEMQQAKNEGRGVMFESADIIVNSCKGRTDESYDLKSFNNHKFLVFVECGYWEYLTEILDNFFSAKKSHEQSYRSVMEYSEMELMTVHSERTTICLIAALRRFMLLVGEEFAVLAKTKEKGTFNVNYSAIAEAVSRGHSFQGSFLVGKWKDFIFNYGKIKNIVQHRGINPDLVFNNKITQEEMRAWFVVASQASPPATGATFVQHVGRTYNTHICERTARRWLLKLGFQYKRVDCKSYYYDGQKRRDVMRDLHEYIKLWDNIEPLRHKYAGDNMNIEVPPDKKFYGNDGKVKQVVVAWHDEASEQCTAQQRLCWTLPGTTGKMQSKRGESAMVSGFVSAEHGKNKLYLHTSFCWLRF